MDDLLEKIKKTEEEANKIIIDAEKEAKKIIEKSRLESVNRINKAKENFFEISNKEKGKKIEKAKKEKEIRIKDKIEDFKRSLDNIDKKKEKAIKFIQDHIKNSLGF